MIAFVFATLHENMINGLVIINGMHPMAFARRLLESVTQMRMSWYFLPFRHEDVPEKYLIMRDFSFFDTIHIGFTPYEKEAHKYMFSQSGALTGALNYYRAFNHDNDQLKKFDYRQINVSTLILWGEQDAFLTTPVALYNQVYLNMSQVVFYPRADENHTRKVILVGHDWGGMISFCFATLYETLIDGIVIINGMHPKAFAKQLFGSVTQMRMSWYQLPFRHPVIPEQYLIMWDLEYFNKMHRVFTEDEKYAHKYMFSQHGALTGAINYYRAFNNDSNQLSKLPYRKINVSTLILWAEKDEYIMTKVAEYNQEWLNDSSVVYYSNAGHWLTRECPSQVTERIREFAGNITGVRTDTTKNRNNKDLKKGKCQESTHPTRPSSLSKMFAWLPSNANLPKEMRGKNSS
ncbi:hypothetical protein HPB50_016523 [Hyalomma asiaticum]|uniref:Uncharacterized protein n=1 Tax=Hyalomma asiaticum TaxID=266040 RepID=A0ACB7RWW8_HYAAI|nr:hypothetical protein HPB50_016523 [Hyalomma asiaticum]